MRPVIAQGHTICYESKGVFFFPPAGHFKEVAPSSESVKEFGFFGPGENSTYYNV